MNKQRRKINNISDVDQKHLAELVYHKAIKEEIEKRLEIKYLKGIGYLVNANNELMKELEQYERVSMQESV